MRELSVWKPLHDPLSWQRNMDGLFDRVFGEAAVSNRSANWLPPLEAYEKDGQYVVRLDLPGVDPKNVDVSAESGVLTVKGERKHDDEGENKGHRYRETSYGNFQRRLTLPKGVDTDKIKARYESGVLEITVLVPVPATGKKVPIEVEAKAA